VSSRRSTAESNVAWLESLSPWPEEFGLGRMRQLLHALGDPQLGYAAVHVVGTNGKTSTTLMTAAVLRDAGLRVGAYISPHVRGWAERIQVDGGDADIEAALARVRPHANWATQFEVITAAALAEFAARGVDVAVVEAGLGGRLDATNVVRRPAVTAITPVSLDHQAFLGDTVAAIAGEKAGILKPEVTAVIAPQPSEAAAVIEARAAAVSAPLYRARHEWRCEASGAGMRYEGERWRLDLPLPSLIGAHQVINAGTAIACVERLSGFDIPAEAIAGGLRHIDWPARLQLLRRGPLVDAVPPGWELWLDGGHNPLAGEILGDVAAGWHDRPLYLVVGMMNTKDAAGFIAPLAKHARALWAVTIPGEKNALPAEAIATAGASVGLPAQTADAVLTAIRDIPVQDGNGRVLICGSLYFAGKVLAENG